MDGNLVLFGGLIIKTPFWTPAPFDGAGGKNARGRVQKLLIFHTVCAKI